MGSEGHPLVSSGQAGMQVSLDVFSTKY